MLCYFRFPLLGNSNSTNNCKLWNAPNLFLRTFLAQLPSFSDLLFIHYYYLIVILSINRLLIVIFSQVIHLCLFLLTSCVFLFLLIYSLTIQNIQQVKFSLMILFNELFIHCVLIHVFKNQKLNWSVSVRNIYIYQVWFVHSLTIIKIIIAKTS